jgi:hypothetical protein
MSRIATMSGWRKSALSSKLNFASERHYVARAGDDQGVDLGERRVGLVEAAVERLQQLRTLADGCVRDADLARDVLRVACR